MKDVMSASVCSKSGRAESLIKKKVISPQHIRCIFLGFFNEIEVNRKAKRKKKMKIYDSWMKYAPKQFNKLHVLHMLNASISLIQLFDESLSKVSIRYLDSSTGFGIFAKRKLLPDSNTPLSIALVLPLNISKTNLINSNDAILPINYYYNTVNFKLTSSKEAPNAMSHIYDVYCGIIDDSPRIVQINAIYGSSKINVNDEIKWDYRNKTTTVLPVSKRRKVS